MVAELIEVLCVEWDMHCWTNNDIIKCAEWGNYNAQRYRFVIKTN